VDAQSDLLAQGKKRIREIFDFRIQQSTLDISQLHARARSLSPQLTLERGYAVITDESGNRIGKISKSTKLQIRTSNQEISATVSDVKEIK
jgi:exodeoxyribonuclease VII large subunit